MTFWNTLPLIFKNIKYNVDFSWLYISDERKWSKKFFLNFCENSGVEATRIVYSLERTHKLLLSICLHWCRLIFQNNTLRSVGDMLFGRHDFHAILFQNVLVMCAIIAVMGETVEFQDKHDLKKPFCAILDHAMKLRTVSGFCRQCAVNVAADNRHTVALGVIAALAELTFNRFFPLAIKL